MGLLAFTHGRLRCLQRLRDHLPAEHAAHAAFLRASGEMIVFARFNRQQFDKPGNELFGRGVISRRVRHASFLADRANAGQRAK